MRIGAVAGVLAVVLAACSAKGRGKDEAEETLPPQVTLIGVKLHGWQGSDLVAIGRAAMLTYDRSTSNFEANEALVQFPSKKADAARRREVNTDLELRAPLATGNLQSRQADGRGGVTVRSASGLRGRTPSAHFDGVALVASGKEPVDIEGPGYSVSANAFTFHFATEELDFEGGVHSRLGNR
ncbi:MAG: hypothetical protein IRZ16_03970 [Myxococcaceae bacterium]|nr:hypothetical protein [Myxococcaceae bacterium]